MNNIPQEQNKQEQIQRLAAQRQIYSDAKTIQNLIIILSVPLALAWSILVVIFPKLQVYANLWGLAVAILTLSVLTPLQTSLQEKAAKIQQLFDCDVLQLDWSQMYSGNRPNPEIIIDYSEKYVQKNKTCSNLLDWYSIVVGSLPMHQARLLCQRENVSWDVQLKRRYARWVIVILVTLVVIICLLGLIGGLTLENVILSLVVPLAPTFIFGLRQYIEHNEAAKRLDRLGEKCQDLWQQVVNNRISPQDLERESYNLQTKIYESRRRSPLVFDWLYERLKKKDEEQMNKTSEAMIKELHQSP